MFPDSATTTEMIPQNLGSGNQDDRIYLASDLEYAMIPVTDASGHTVVQQVIALSGLSTWLFGLH